MNERFTLPAFCPRQILSGAFHYFRVHPGLWDARLDQAVAFGLNTIETYIPWNLHEPHRGEFHFEAPHDLESFIRKVGEHGLKLILRPGPYICAEWDNGGFPGWLSAIPEIRFRRMNRPYLEEVARYFHVLLPKLKKHLATSGGPVILLQIENEYGSYGNDKEYLEFLRDLYTECGMDVPFFTSDGPYNPYAKGGELPGVWAAGNFGSNTARAFESLRANRPGEEDFCAEFWVGWFDHWGKGHQSRPVENGVDTFYEDFEEMLRRGAHCNIYMFHGGTNFGFSAGANGNRLKEYEATITSYDYDCMVSECGDPTERFFRCQKLIRKYLDNPRITEAVSDSKKIVPKPVKLTGSASLFSQLARLDGVSGTSGTPPTLEELGENSGFVYYKHILHDIHPGISLCLFEANDFVQVWEDRSYLGSRMRCTGEDPFKLTKNGTLELELLVENLGRINYGPYTGIDRKGIAGGVALELEYQFGWEYKALPLKDLSRLEFGPFANESGQVMFHRGEFELQETGEAFLSIPGIKGTVWINGFHLGRYWNIGPAKTLYVPSPVLKKGKNELIILEQEKLNGDEVHFNAFHDLGEPPH